MISAWCIETASCRDFVISADVLTNPDIVAVCGETRFDDDYMDTLLNPTIIVEVLSESTEAYDRGLKFEQYRKLESLSEYLLVAQDKYHIEHYVRQSDNRWLLSETGDVQSTVQFSAIDAHLSLTDLYDKVELSRRQNLR